MTCIVGLEHDGKVYMGGDGAAVDDDFSYFVADEPKVFKKSDNFLVGYCGSFRMGQLLQYALEIPVHPPDKGDLAYLITDFITAVRKCFKDHELEKEDRGDLLIGYKGRLYLMENFQILRNREGYYSVGTAYDIALGSLHATPHLAPQERIELALKAAAAYSAAVKPPYTVISG
jgi:ATP-dependent protease HslVU (ClpYQ) peptidase subunit